LADSSARLAFQRIARTPDAQIDLAEAALWVAAEEYPGLDVARWLAHLGELAATASARLEGARGTLEAIERLNAFLYGEERFAGNREDYYDPRNSFLNEVLERRKGIPITLAIVYVWIARRACARTPAAKSASTRACSSRPRRARSWRGCCAT